MKMKKILEKYIDSFDFWLLRENIEQGEINNKSIAIKTFRHFIKEMDNDSFP